MCHWGKQVDGCDTLGLDSIGQGSATFTRSFIRGGAQGEKEREVREPTTVMFVPKTKGGELA